MPEDAVIQQTCFIQISGSVNRVHTVLRCIMSCAMRRTIMNGKGMLLRIALAGSLPFLANAVVAMAQTTATTGAIGGVVTDPSGAAVPHTTLTLTSATTGRVTTTE